MPKSVAYASKKKNMDSNTENAIENDEELRRCELKICAEENVSSTKGFYILSLCGTQSEPDFKIAAAFSNFSTTVYSVCDTFSKVITLDKNSEPIVGIKFSPTSKNILYTATQNGVITACDLRAKGKVIATVRDSTPDGKRRPLSSFEISSDDRLVVAGSEHVGGDAFILFWDLRYNSGRTEGKSELLGGYWESHMDDITSLSFHPKQLDILASGSTDGLINIFDLKQNTEDLALKYSLNTESSVDRLGWLDNGNVWCTTHTHELQLWDCDDAQPYSKFERNVIGSSMNSDLDTGYVVKMHNTSAFDRPFLLAGSSTTTNSELVGLSVEDGNLEMCYDMPGNKQLVRDSWYHEKSGCLVTGGEMGILNLWKENDTIAQNEMSKALGKFVGKAREKVPRSKPY